jgi:short-subunit dehydrogenase
MDVELRGRGVRVSTVHPIGTRTEFFDTAHSKSEDAKFTKRTPRFAMQHPETVAKAIVKCLRRPKPEVWTSFPTRTAIGIAAMFPKATDAVMRRMMRDGLKK